MTSPKKDGRNPDKSAGTGPSGKKSSGKAGTAGSPVGDAEVDGASADESGYRRDDYWREESREGGPSPTDVPEPSEGYGFQTPEERAKADDDTSDTSSSKRKEQGNAGGRDDARIVDD